MCKNISTGTIAVYYTDSYLYGLNKYKMANPRKKFTLIIPIDYAGAAIGNVTLECIAYLYADGTLRTVDINEASFNGKDIADYVSAAQPDVWDEWMGAAEDHFKRENEEPAPVEHDSDNTGEGYLRTNII